MVNYKLKTLNKRNNNDSNNYNTISENALKIANEWHYDAPYDFYDMQNDIEDYEEIISPSLRQNNYYQVTNNNDLVGFSLLNR